MVQVRSAASNSFSDWFYQPADSFALYGGTGVEGAFAHAFDFSDLGLTAGEEVDTIRIVNLTDEDRMFDSSGVGQVDPEGGSATTLPDPGTFASFTEYGSSTLDPDPLYVAALHDITAESTGPGPGGSSLPEPSSFFLVLAATAWLGLRRNRRRR